MKKITVTIENYIDKYKAFDGTEFDIEEECRKYEKTAECHLKHRFNKYVINDTFTEWDLLSTGNSEHRIDIVEIPNDEAVKDIVQYYSYYHDYMQEHYISKFADKVEKAYQEGDLLIFGYNYDRECYFIDSRNNIVDRLLNIKNELNNKED